MPEIERKFRVAQLPDALGAGVPLRQAYVALDGDVEVRVRREGADHRLTVKGGRGLQRAEVELPLSADEFDELWRLAGARTLAKARHRVPLGPDGLVAEVDLYEGPLAGLAVVEVEFSSEAQAQAFAAPHWFGAELTGQPGWSNAELAVHGQPAT